MALGPITFVYNVNNRNAFGSVASGTVCTFDRKALTRWETLKNPLGPVLT